jgi:putative DNA primase/helicase
LLIVANKPFEPKEADSAWYRRVINVPFNREVPLDQKESLLEIQGDRFVGKFEPYIAGLLDKVLSIPDETVKAFLEKTSKYVPSLDEHKAEMILYSNPLAQWCDENLVLLPTAKTHIGDGKKQSISTEMQGGVRINHIKYEDSDKLLFPNHCQFCIYRGNNPISLQIFSRRLLEIVNGVLKVNTVKKDRDTDGVFIIGLAIRTPDHANIPTPIKKTLLNNVDLMAGNVDLMKTETHTSEGSVDHVGFFQISASSKQEPEFW